LKEKSTMANERTFDRTVHLEVNKLLTDLMLRYDSANKDFEAKEVLALRQYLYWQFIGNSVWVREAALLEERQACLQIVEAMIEKVSGYSNGSFSSEEHTNYAIRKHLETVYSKIDGMIK
jgi:hypothetical protein